MLADTLCSAIDAVAQIPQLQDFLTVEVDSFVLFRTELAKTAVGGLRSIVLPYGRNRHD